MGQHEYQERDRTWMIRDPLLFFVLDGVRYAVANQTVDPKESDSEPMTYADARNNVLKWFPDAEIVIPELEEHGGRL